MRTIKTSVIRTALAGALLLTAGGAYAQTAATVGLTAARQSTLLPDGQTVPMWGWTCGTVSGATCAAANGVPQLAGGATWQPPLIRVPTGSSLSITLKNTLPAVNTSLVIVGQLPGGSLGTPVREAVPRTHAPQTSTTWPIVSAQTFTPPTQGLRARSFVPEAAPGGTATYTWPALRPGTYLIESGTYPSIQGPMGLYGVLVVTTAPVAATTTPVAPFVPGIAYTVGVAPVQYDADVPLLLSEVDPVQNAAADAAILTSGFSETTKWSQACGAAGTHTCYPAAVNYTPLYYMINGTSFDPSHPNKSTMNVPASATSGNVLLRVVNAGLRMHVPTAVGLPMALIAEDGNVAPDVALALGKALAPSPKLQGDWFMAAGKVYDLMVHPTASAGAYTPAVYPVFDRQLSLSNNNQRDGGMQGLIIVNGGPVGTGVGQTTGGMLNPYVAVHAVADNYIVPVGTSAAKSFTANVLSNDVGISTPVVVGTAPAGTSLALNGLLTYTGTASATFQYCGNGVTAPNAACATVTLKAATVGGAPKAVADTYTSNVSTLFKVIAPGVLANDTDPAGYPLTARASGTLHAGVTLNSDGSFVATSACGNPCTFSYQAVNSQGTASNVVTSTVTFNPGSGLKVTVQDAITKAAITDYKWIIEQDLTFQLDPAKQVNNGTIPPTLGTNFHTSFMPVIATGCTGPQSCERGQTVYDPKSGTHVSALCDGSGICVPDTANAGHLPISTPDQAHLAATNPDGSPAKYFISILPGDVTNPFNTANGADPTVSGNCVAGATPTGQAVASNCGHSISGAPVVPVTGSSPVTYNPVVVNSEPNPLKPAQLTAFVFEDDAPLNGEQDVSGGSDIALGTANEPGLEGFQVEIWDDAGSSGDATGQMTYDMFNMPLTNSLAGTIDPKTGLNACPISNGTPVGMILVCPKFESDGKTYSPLVGNVVVKNLMPGRFGITVHPSAAREAAGEEWLQTNTLDGTHFLDSFLRSGEPAYFQEFGPGGFHVFFGMANPKIINARKPSFCPTGTYCNNTINGSVSNLHMSRPTSEILYDSAVFPAGDPRNNQAFAHTQCYASLGDPDGLDFAFAKCDQNGKFQFTGIPDGNWSLKVFDEWLDLIVDGTAKPVNVAGGSAGSTVSIDYPAFTWQTHIWQNTYLDINGNGIQDPGEPGIGQVPSRIRMRNGKFNNTLFSDSSGNAHFNETFPLFNWYVAESDNTRFKNSGVHIVVDAGGQIDGPAPAGNGNTGAYQGLLNSTETLSVPGTLRVPGAVYCAKGDAACANSNLANPSASVAPGTPSAPISTGRIDPGSVVTEGVQNFLSQTAILEWGKQPYVAGENGGFRGHVAYSSTRPFDDPSQVFQNLWEPLVPGVTVNLYQEGTGPDGTQTLTLVDTTKTSSWDAWAQGTRADGLTPNMNCPGQDPADPFVAYTLAGTKQYLNPNTALPSNSLYKCYDGLHAFNQVQPAPYDGMYQFPSAAYAASHPLTTAQRTAGQTLVSFAPGKYVVEVVPPPGYEIVKEEDKNILIGDNFIAPATVQFAGLGDIFIVPDQATINNTNPAYGSGGGATNPTTDMGRTYNVGGFGPGGNIVMPAPCVGALRVVPDYMSISPESGEVAPFAGASRHLCDRKELVLEDQMQAQADFFVWTKTPAAAHFTGFILDDFSSEFDPASPGFGEKFAVPNLPISIKDFNGVEVSRLYSDQWGIFNGMTYSTFDVNPPNPTGYAPNMMITCMNDPGPILDTRAGSPTLGKMITDPAYNPAYSNFCYENAFMPQDTAYLDTPVVPTQAYAEGYNPPDCDYPDGTPAISTVTGDASGGGAGPWVSAAGHTLTITALGDKLVNNNAYSGPSSAASPYNQKKITRHYGFGATKGTVTIGGASAPVTGWTDATITVTVPINVPACTIQQQGTLGTLCGELAITTTTGKQSIDAVTVTVGGKAPTYVAGENAANNALQSAIDAATPGDLVMVGPGSYNEMLLMWKPLRLQGVGAASVTVNANTHPSGKIDAWRQEVNCLFGLGLNGYYIGVGGTTAPPGCTAAMQGSVDPLPLEVLVGWDANLNGNLAEILQEPSLMGAYEGAAITVLAKGVQNDPAGTAPGTGNCSANGVCTPLTASPGDCTKYPSNFLCNPARIDGMSFTNSSQGGGGIFLHGYNHYMEIANNRVFGNAGTLTGGLTVGQAEVADGTISGTTELPYLYDKNVNVHNNAITGNSSFGDELNSTTPGSAGGVTFCSGTDYYKFNYNWICGNLSSGDGGGMAHYGFSYNGDIEHNWFLYNQSTNPTLPTWGGGLILQGAAPDGTLCENSAVDVDCAPELTDGIGPGTVVNANLFQGNTAESGSGGGLRLQSVNGTDVQRNPNNPLQWHRVDITNNLIVNNVAGWAGGGVSIQDAVNVHFINNTVASNDTTATAGVLFDTLGAPNSNVPPPGCNPITNVGCTNPVTTSNFEPAGLETHAHTGLFAAVFPTSNQTCFPGTSQCWKFSNPVMDNNLFWQNRAFHITTGANPIAGAQNVVTLVPQLDQTSTGQCPATGYNNGPGPTYWDIGVQGDMLVNGAPNHASGYTLNPTYSILDDPGYNAGTNPNHNQTPASAGLAHQFCNGSRLPPETAKTVCTSPSNAPGCAQNGNGNTGITVPPGVPDGNPFYPLFTLSPAATVDEGNNWINMFFGPLTLSNPTITTGQPGYGIPLGMYQTVAGSPANGAIPPLGPTYSEAPATDYYGMNRKGPFTSIDIGAIKFH